MIKLSKNIFESRSYLQWLSRESRSGRGKEIMDRLAANLSPPSAETNRLQQELNGIVSAAAQADLDAAFQRGDFWTDPPGRTWPSTVFTAGEATFGKIMSKALERGK